MPSTLDTPTPALVTFLHELTHSHSLTKSHSLTHEHSLTNTHEDSLAHKDSLAHSKTHSRTHSRTHSLSLTRSLTKTHCCHSQPVENVASMFCSIPTTVFIHHSLTPSSLLSLSLPLCLFFCLKVWKSLSESLDGCLSLRNSVSRALSLSLSVKSLELC